jgi:hypothetical protein
MNALQKEEKIVPVFVFNAKGEKQEEERKRAIKNGRRNW